MSQLLSSIFYVSSNGDVYAPLPRNRSLVAEPSHAQKPGLYILTLQNNSDMPSYLKKRVLMDIFGQSVQTAAAIGCLLEQGKVSFGPYTHEVVETKNLQIRALQIKIGYKIPLILENS